MKSILSLPIVHNHNLPLYPPTIEDNEDVITVNLQYQSVSYACQGEWKQYVRNYKKSEYNLNAVSKEITDFIKWYYIGHFDI
jgi:hypothetical protein